MNAQELVAAAVEAAQKRLDDDRETFTRRAELTDAEWWKEARETEQWWQW